MRKIFYQETRSDTVEMEYEEALSWAKERALSQINDEIPEEAQVLNTSFSVEENTVQLTVLCLEDIGVGSLIE